MTKLEQTKKFIWRHTVRRVAPLKSPESAPAPAPLAAPQPEPVRPGNIVPIGRHLDAVEQQVEVASSPGQLQVMFDRVAANWRRFGETEPHWSVLTNPIYLRENYAAHVEPFFEHGRHNVRQFLAFASRAGLPSSGFARALDFGCGVGRLTVALAPHADAVVGVDVSQGHLAEAGKSAADHGVANAEFRRIHAIDGIDALGEFDLIVSHIVLQHNPPPVMAAIYGKLLARLRPGGIAIVQMPTFIRHYSFSVAGYLQGEDIPMEMNALPQHEIFRIIAEQGCRALEVREDDHLGEGLDGLSHVFAVVRP